VKHENNEKSRRGNRKHGALAFCLLSQIADQAADVAMNFSGGADHQALQRPVVK